MPRDPQHDDAILRERTRILRGRILEALAQYRRVAAADVQITQLVSVLGDGDRSEIETQVDYLREKGYVEDATTRLDHRHRVGVQAVRITAAGIDLVEGVTEDDAIVFG